MFVILTYDVGQKRVSGVMKTCRRYLRHVQNSVFEGTITGARLNALKSELGEKIEKNVDSICIYEFDSIKFSRKEQLGVVEVFTNIVD